MYIRNVCQVPQITEKPSAGRRSKYFVQEKSFHVSCCDFQGRNQSKILFFCGRIKYSGVVAPLKKNIVFVFQKKNIVFIIFKLAVMDNTASGGRLFFLFVKKAGREPCRPGQPAPTPTRPASFFIGRLVAQELVPSQANFIIWSSYHRPAGQQGFFFFKF